MKQFPAISVIIPMYNVEKFINTTLDSILNQTFQDFEVIVVDDCSTDKSYEFVSKYTDFRIKLFRQVKNSGEGDSRNLGLKIARGKYVFFMDSDDALVSNVLEKFYQSIEKSQADIVYMNSYFLAIDPNFTLPGKIDVDIKRFFDPTPRFLSENLNERLQKEYFEVGVHVTPWIKIQRRDFLQNYHILFPKIFRNSDVLFNFAELCFGRKIQVIDASGYIYRPSEKSVMRNSSLEKRLQATIVSIPSALEFVEEVLSSTNIIYPLDDNLKMQIEMEVVTRFFKLYVLDTYDDGISTKQINNILDEIMSNPKMFSPKFVRVLFNTLAVEMLENEKLKGESL